MIRSREEIINELVSTNLTQQQLTLLVQLIAALPSRDVTHNERDETKRERGRIRQQNYRNRKRNEGGMAAHAGSVTQDVTHNERDADALNLSSFLPFEKGETEEVRKEESKKERARNKRKPAVPLPSDWQPNAAHFEAAKRLGRPEGFVESKAEDLRIWAESKDERKANWDATFHGFIRRDNSNGASNAKTGNVVAAADKLIGRLADLNRPAPNFGGAGSIRSGESEGSVRLLSKGRCERS